tara:strand:- start:2153 stop:3499 length:1347 start_codon:yes stop_codon:yes gene_type:complete
MVNNYDNRLNNLFDQAKIEPVHLSFKETKEQFVHSANSTGKSEGKVAHSINLKLIGMITILSALFVTAVIYNNPNQEPSKNSGPTETMISAVNKDSIDVIHEAEKVIHEYYSEIIKESKLENTREIELTAIEKELIQLPEIEFVEEVKKRTKKVRHFFEQPYRFPKLTADEIKANNKQKAKMIKLLKTRNRKNNKRYKYIPSGTSQFKTGLLSFQAFYMQATEVTNLEYRTFLFDLLIKGDKVSFLIAKPDQQMWSKEYPDSYVEQMEKLYFSHVAYNEYPVVAISREGALLYCKWLTESVNNSKSSKDAFMNDVRIPSAYEWMRAAKGDQPSKKFPCVDSMRNENGCYLANYSPDTGMSSDGGMFPVKVSSYLSNEFGLFCMAGNVSEMVIYHDDNYRPGTKGGNWNSKIEELKIEGVDPYLNRTKPSVNIGFRVVVTYRKSETLEK